MHFSGSVAGNPPAVCLHKKKKEEKNISNQPIIFNISYTPYKIRRDASTYEQEKFKQQRAFYEMSGDGNNIYKYITNDRKLNGENSKTETRSMIQYFEKSTGVFNDQGGIIRQQLHEIQQRAKAHKNLWHGFISLNEEMSYKIDCAEKCVHLVKRTFGDLFKDMGLDPKNIDLICALHKDKPHHLHIHFWFAEKEPKCKYRGKNLEYRHKGKIPKAVIDKMHIRLNLYIDESHPEIYNSRDVAIKELKRMTFNKRIVEYNDVKKAVIALAKEIPKTASFFYGKRDMELYRDKVDNIAHLLVLHDRRVAKASANFYINIAQLNKKIKALCNTSHAGKHINHYKIDSNNITLTQDLVQDFKRRQGNIILQAVKQIKGELYQTRIRHKVNDKPLKRRLAISHRKVGKLFDNFILSYIEEIQTAEQEYSKKIQQEENDIDERTAKNYKYNYGK